MSSKYTKKNIRFSKKQKQKQKQISGKLPLNEEKRNSTEKIIELSISNFSHDLRGIGKLNGKTCFVRDGLPGETLLANVESENSRFIQAQTKQILTSSAHRVSKPLCPHFYECGGCDLQHLNYSEQVKAKERSLLEQLERISGIKPTNVELPITGFPTQYRNRARLAVDVRKSRIIGFKTKASNKIFSLQECQILVPELQILIEPLQKLFALLRSPESFSHLELIASQLSQVVIWRQISPLPSTDIDYLNSFAEKLGVVFYIQRENRRELFNLKGEHKNPRLSYTHTETGMKLKFHPQDFIQGNTPINKKMVNQTLDWLTLTSKDVVWDLFSGIGNFSIPMASTGATVLGVEGSDEMSQRASENAQLNGLENAFFVSGNLMSEEYFTPEKITKHFALKNSKIKSNPNVIVIDPPRSGAAVVANRLKDIAERILYISCNPSSFSRDAEVIVENGYKLTKLGVIDLYPQTAHIESMALFTRS